MSRKHLPRRRALALLPALLLAAQATAKGVKKPAAVPLRGEQAEIGWCPKMYADKRRANKKQQRHGIFELCKFKLPFAVPVAVDRI